MRIARTVEELADCNGTIGFVPTMGALHEGHLSLIRAAAADSEFVVVSLFVNPLQFGPNEDLAKYPRNEARDLELAEASGADLVFAPSAQDMTSMQETYVIVRGVSELYEGVVRPGHFDGVATIVLKLLNLVAPRNAYFGLKDRQQCAVIRRMCVDLNLPVRLSFMPTVRETDGLAMSSRNAYLSSEERAVAPRIYETLLDARNDALANPNDCKRILRHARTHLEGAGFNVDYFDLVNEQTFRPTEVVSPSSVFIVAARLGRTRLIDNISAVPD